jgi:glycosyltransferase involved in cell wall biosynthesis
VRRLKVVAHNGAAVFGGAEKATALLLAGLQARGHEVVIYCRDAERAARFAAFGLAARVFSLGGDLMVHNAWRFARVLEREAPDVLLLTTFKKSPVASFAGKLAGVPNIIVRIGLSTDVPRNWKYRFALTHFVNAVTLNAADMREAFLAPLPGMDPSLVVTVGKGVPQTAATSWDGAVRDELGLGADVFVLGVLARLVKQKRIDRLLHALCELPSNVHCVIAGEGELLGELETLTVKLSLYERVHWLGQRDDLADVLAAMDVLVISSDKESLANAMLEALAAGVPVISTPVSGAPQALQPFADEAAPGIVVGYSAEEIAGAIGLLLDSPDLLARMKRAAVRRWREDFGFERMLDRWEAVLSRGRTADNLDAGAAPDESVSVA